MALVPGQKPDVQEATSTKVVLGWTVLWLLSNMSTTILNKAAFHFAKFYFPLTLSAFHLLLHSIFTTLWFRYSGQQQVELDSHGMLLMLPFSVLFGLNIVIGNAALRLVTVSFSQVMRSTVPTITVVLSALILKKFYPLRVKLALVPILIGVCLSTYGDLDFNNLGFILMVITCFLASLKAVLSNKFLTGDYKLPALDLLNRTAPLALLITLPAAAMVGEVSEKQLDWWQTTTISQLVIVVASAMASLGLNYASFKMNQATSALSLTVAGNVKEALTIFVSLFIFQNKISPLNGLGILTVIFGSSLYSYFQYQSMRAVAAAIPRTQ